MLHHYEDQLCLDFMGYYSHFLNKDLFLYSLRHANSKFMKNALMISAFDKSIFKEEDLVQGILVYLEDGSKTNFILNVLQLIEIS